MPFKVENDKKKRCIRRVIRTIKWIIILFVLYVFVAGFLMFHFIDYSGRHNPFDLPSYRDEEEELFLEESVDHAILLESMEEGGMARLHIIDNAQESIDVAYYTFHPGTSLDVFLGAIVNAADRGVEVRILLDGLFHNLRLSDRRILYGLEAHQNIEIHYYEPINLLKPWTIQNRLHDKLIVVDEKHVIIGGRNIGERYFNSEDREKTVLDRDVWVVNHIEEESNRSVLPVVQEYFNELWESPYSVAAKHRLLRIQRFQGEGYLEDLRGDYRVFLEKYPQYARGHELLEKAHSTSEIHFIHNPIERWRKAPWIWETLIYLMDEAEEEIWLQSPYFIPSLQMRKDLKEIVGMEYLEFHENLKANQYILTNSIETNPNFFGRIGYYYHRQRMIDAADEVFEYRGEESLHGKTYVLDGKISMIGAFNYDPRSAYLSTESMIVIYGKDFAGEVIDEIDCLSIESQLLEEIEETSFSLFDFFIRILSYIVPIIEPML